MSFNVDFVFCLFFAFNCYFPDTNCDLHIVSVVSKLQAKSNRCLFLHIKFYWRTATPVCLRVVCSGFRAVMTELSS